MDQTQPALRHRGRESWIIVAYFAGTLLLGAALAPPLFWAAKAFASWAAEAGWAETPGVKFVRDAIVRSDFTRVFNRAVLIAALICLWPAARALRIRRGELGLVRNPTPWRDLSVGFLIAAGMLLALASIYLGTGAFVWKKNIAWLAVLKDSVVRAAGAATLEEFFFRGALLGLMLRTSSRRTALLFVTTVYAAVHFLQPPDHIVLRDGINAGSGFWLVGEILRTFANAQFLLAQFATLWVAGSILGLARLRHPLALAPDRHPRRLDLRHRLLRRHRQGQQTRLP